MRHLVLTGTPLERGLLHGKTWTKEIHELAVIRKSLLLDTLKTWSVEKVSKLAEDHLKILQRDSELWEEFRGISEGAKISLVDLMILNNHTDMRDFGDSDFDDSVYECSCFAFKQGTHLIAGQTWDMHGSAQDYVAHLTLKKENTTQEIFTLTGCLGLTGVALTGTSVFINNLRSREVKVGYAWPAVVRKLLDAPFEKAEETLNTYMPSAGRNFLLSNGQIAVNYEVTGKQILKHDDVSKGYLFHTNHYLSTLKNTEEASTRSQTTFRRYEYLQDKVPQIAKEALNLKNISQKLFSDSVGTLSMARSSTNPNSSATCGGLIYDYEKKEGVSFEGLFSDKKHLYIKHGNK